MTAPVSLRAQADCAARELVMRHRVYPGLIKRGKMTEAEAAGEIAAMRAIRDTLRLFAEHETAMRSALAKAIEGARYIEAEKDNPAVRALRETFPEAACVEVHDGTCEAPPDIDAHTPGLVGLGAGRQESGPARHAVEGSAP